MDTLTQSVPVEPEGTPPRRPWWKAWGWWLFGAIVLAGLVGAAFVRLPYYALSPGQATGTVELVEVPGEFRNEGDGDVLFLTVSVRRVTALGALAGWLDPDVSIVPEEEVLGSRTPEENRTFNRQLMDISKDVAIYVALGELGYDVPVSGGGALVREVVPDAPAAEVLSPGDVIVAAGGEPVVFSDDLRAATVGLQPGDLLELDVVREDGREDDVVVELTAREDGSPLIGVAAVTSTPIEFDFPVDVQIDSGTVGGPSAGLAFTLSVLDVLTPGELTGGETVAVTGTMGVDGAVGPVGGVEQKAAAAREAGATLLLVPESEVQDARDHAGDLEVQGVASLDEALQALDSVGGNALALGQPGSADRPAA